MRLYYLFLFFSLIFGSSCTDEKIREINEGFPETVKLIAEEKEIREIIRPVEMVIHKNYLIIQNDQIPEVSCFYVYSLDSLNYLYHFARLGNGRDEFVAPLITRCKDTPYFFVFDQAKRKLAGYSLSDSGAHLVIEKLIQEDSKTPFQEMSFISDSIFLFLSVNNEIISYNINRDMIIDTLTFSSDIKDKVYGEREYNKSLDFFYFSNMGDKIVTGHNFINKITTNTCNANGLFENKNISLSAYTRSYMDSHLYNNMYYYMFVEATPNFIFAEYYGYSFLQLQPFPVNTGCRHFDFILEVYDWNSDKKAILEFDSDILRCTIDEKREKIYTWNPLKDFDYLLCYDMNELYQE
jgi:hypothetical protein